MWPLAAVLPFLVVGCECNAGFSSNAPKAPGATGAPGGAKFSGPLEVQAFKGGFGIDFYQKAAEEFDQKNPGLKTTVAGDPHIWEQLRPRLVAGDPPDLMFPGWGMDHWALAEEGQLQTLDAALDSPAYDGKGTWRSTFEPALLKIGQKDGVQYVLPYYYNVYGWWYDPDVFAKHGWTPPKTFEELLGLAEKIKAAGIAPVTFQGKYPYYMIHGMLLPWAISAGGIQAANDAQNLVPGAWKSPAMLQAARMIATLRDRKDFENGAVGLSHTESQTDFLNGKAAMIPCGTWLYSEMQKVMRPGAKMQFMLPPVTATGKGDPTALMIDIEPWMVPAKAKNPDAALGLYKYMTSLDKAKQFVTEKGSLMSIKGSDEVKLPDTLVEPAKAFKNSKTVWSYEMRYWYPDMEKEIENALTSMLDGQSTPEQFCDRAEAAADKARKDDSLPKHKV
jgi:N-acetylglucosamine transport system substrate-binding protein